jgi:hypothetical protein
MGALEGQELDSARREKDMQALTTISIRQRRSDLSFAPALHYTCADARWANVGAFAGLEDVVVLALSDRDRHASVASSVRGLADLRRRCVLELELVGIGLLPFQPVEHLEARGLCGGRLSSRDLCDRWRERGGIQKPESRRMSFR